MPLTCDVRPTIADEDKAADKELVSKADMQRLTAYAFVISSEACTDRLCYFVHTAFIPGNVKARILLFVRTLSILSFARLSLLNSTSLSCRLPLNTQPTAWPT